MRLTTRGKVVLGLAIALAVYLLALGVDHINWMGDHYCFKSSIECYFGK